ncbi:MAG: methyltransferase domain-containing protein [Syntrophaceae bacterium]|nr:methyltransferase domain-containing protein [Syntrophaceae bacterium]
MASSELKKTGKEYRKDEHDHLSDYLCVDRFLPDMLHARALSTAFESGLVDALVKARRVAVESLTAANNISSRGMRLLLTILRENRVIEEHDGVIALTEEFVHALAYRDILELKSSMAHLAAHDLLDYFEDFVFNPDRFTQRARYFRLFAYNKCFTRSPENETAAKRWMRFTTTLTRYEAPVCLKYHDFSKYGKILDVGGNSGEFALQICRTYPEIHATVFDLPLVCDIGMEHVKNQPGGDRVTFVKGNALLDEFPGQYDLITFKSMLHDWPEREAAGFLAKADRALAPGGTLLIFERGTMESIQDGLPYAMIPLLLFFHSFRLPEIYEEHLKKLGFDEIQITFIELDMPFFLLIAKKKNDETAPRQLESEKRSS